MELPFAIQRYDLVHDEGQGAALDAQPILVLIVFVGEAVGDAALEASTELSQRFVFSQTRIETLGDDKGFILHAQNGMSVGSSEEPLPMKLLSRPKLSIFFANEQGYITHAQTLGVPVQILKALNPSG